MRSITRSAFRVASATALLGLLLPVVLAHGEDDNMSMDMGEGVAMAADEPSSDIEYPPTYFALAEHRGVLVAHIALMILAWVVVLPLGTVPDELAEIQNFTGLDLRTDMTTS